MILEHFIYSAALAVIISILYIKYFKRDPTWIIICVALVPDIDYPLQYITPLIHHGSFHNLIGLIGFTILSSTILIKLGIKWVDATICVVIGFSAHLLEDIFVYNPGYAALYPITDTVFGWKILPETRNLFGLGDTTIYLLGIILLLLAVGLKYILLKKWNNNL